MKLPFPCPTPARLPIRPPEHAAVRSIPPTRGGWRISVRTGLLALAALLLPALTCAHSDPTPVTLQLKWQHQFQFAGFYAAVEKGFYQEEGLAVTIREARPGQHVVDTVLGGEAEFGVGAAGLLLDYAQGAPVVVLGVTMQHSPLAFLTIPETGITNLHDLSGRRVMYETGSAELEAYLSKEGLNLDLLETVPHGFSIDPLMSGEVDAMTAYVTDEVFELEHLGQPYLLLRPVMSGIDFYGDVFFTSRSQVSQHPERVEAFRRATVKGWTYAMRHPREMAELILDKYGSLHDFEHLMFEARQMHELMHPDVIEPGYMQIGRWRHIADTYAMVGMLPADLDLEGFVYTPPTAGNGYRWMLIPVLLGVLALLIVSAIAVYVHRLNLRLRESEARYRVVYENAPVAFMLWDHQLRVTGWNRHAETIFGWSREDMVGRDFMRRLVPSDETDHCHDVIHELVATGAVTRSTNWNVTRDGGRILCEWMNTALRDSQGRVVGFASLAVDVTERHRAEEALRASEQKFRLLAENALDVIWTLDFDGRITYVSPSVERLRGFKPQEIIGRTMKEALTPESYEVARDALAHLRTHGELPADHYTFEQPCKDGSTVWTDMTVTPMRSEDGEILGFLGITRDITRQRETEERLTYMAHHDPLTDLPNRSLFFDRLNMSMARALREDLPLALLYIDLDGFKSVNDMNGHQVGDYVLSQVALRLKRAVREMDTVARIGGDEFTVLIASVKETASAYQVADKIIEALSQPIELSEGNTVKIGASIGVAFYPTDAQTSDALLRKADQAMYSVKRDGKGRYHHPGAGD